MRYQRLPQQMIGMALVLLCLAGCGSEPAQPSGRGGTNEAADLSPLGVLQSTDHGGTWTSLGNAYMSDLMVEPADPTGFATDSGVVLYFVDLSSLSQPVPHSIYRVASTDGVNFDRPQPVYTQTEAMVDPCVLPMQDGTFRLYVPSGGATISAASADGLAFALEDGARITEGGMPGGLLLPDNRVRMFVCLGGIFSHISDDGLNFKREDGMRISSSPGTFVDNPQPLRLRDGTYLMLYQSAAESSVGQVDGWRKEIHLATSTDGYNWATNPAVIATGGTSALVEMPDGTLLIYYGN